MADLGTMDGVNFIDRDMLASRSDRIASLGSFCITSSILKYFGLKSASMPFDWLFAAPDAVIDCLENDFVHFLDRDQHVSLTEHAGKNSAGHLRYDRDVYAEGMFNHRDITEDEHYDYYLRCVERFRALLASDRDKLFILICDRLGEDQTLFHRVSALLRERTVKSHLIAISLHHISHTPACLQIYKMHDEDGHRFYKFGASSPHDGVQFQDDLDNLAVLRMIQQAVLEFAD